MVSKSNSISWNSVSETHFTSRCPWYCGHSLFNTTAVVATAVRIPTQTSRKEPSQLLRCVETNPKHPLDRAASESSPSFPYQSSNGGRNNSGWRTSSIPPSSTTDAFRPAQVKILHTKKTRIKRDSTPVELVDGVGDTSRKKQSLGWCPLWTVTSPDALPSSERGGWNKWRPRTESETVS